MRVSILFIFAAVFTWSCSSSKEVVKPIQEQVSTDVPIITYDLDTIHIGTLKEGEKRQLLYTFQNTGSQDLIIDLATACRCTDLQWPQEPIPPGERGEILVEFDSAGFSGDVIKTIDVISNTEPIVKLAWFTATIVKE